MKFKGFLRCFQTKPLNMWLTLGLVLAFFLLYICKAPCVIETVFGLPCPTCGMTRAYGALFHLQIREAFALHPMFWSVPVLLWYVYKNGHPFRRTWLNYTVLACICAGFVVVYMVRILSYI